MFLSACFKEDDKLNPPDHEHGTYVEIALESNYKQQIYYNLSKQEVVKQNVKTAWDLMFDAQAMNFNIRLNSAKWMHAINTHSTDFETVYNPNDFTDKRFDYESGSDDSLAIMNWGYVDGSDCVSKNLVYLIDRGYDENGNELGWKKIQLNGCNNGVFTLKAANLDGSESLSYHISQNNDYLHKMISLDDSSVLNIEPPKNDWDILFTQYTTWLWDPDELHFIEYLVVGALINNERNAVAFDTLNRYEEISYLESVNLDYHSNIDVIGYGWKNPGNVTGGSVNYTVYDYITYVVKQDNTNYYKVRFLRFVNDQGQKGYPFFELTPL